MRWRMAVTGMLLAVGLAACERGGGEAGRPLSQASPDIPKTAWWKEGAGTTAGAVAEDALAQPMLASWEAVAGSPDQIQRGNDLFENKGCVSCHSFGQGQVVGPDLQGITRRVDADWVQRFISAPDQMLQDDPRARDLLAKYAVAMPNLNLSADEVTALVQFLKSRDVQAAQAQAK